MGTTDEPTDAARVFERERMRGARFRLVDLTGARFDQVAINDAVMRGVELANVDIDGEIVGLRINGVEVAPLIDAELDRRDPDRRLLRAEDPEGLREAWAMNERRWAATVERARQLEPSLLHESVDGEWSFIQTLRHLVFATESWVHRALLGDPAPWDPRSLPFDTISTIPAIPQDRDTRYPLDDILALRADRMATVRRVLEDLTPERLAEDTDPVDAPGFPAPRRYAVRSCLGVVLNEEWHHRVFAERDLAVLEAGHDAEPEPSP